MSPELSAEPTQVSREGWPHVAWLGHLTSAPRVDSATRGRCQARPPEVVPFPAWEGPTRPAVSPGRLLYPLSTAQPAAFAPPLSLTVLFNCPPPSP